MVLSALCALPSALSKEVLVKKTIVGFAVVALLLLAGGCKGRESAAGGATETIAPAQPKPDATGSDAMTQTVDVEDSRSEAEGAGLNSTTTAKTSTAPTATATTGTTENPTTTVAPPTTTTH
jgi:hypothetical protein